MKTVVLDFEAFHSAEYTLRKMTPVEYILDPRFQVIGCAVRDDDFLATHGRRTVFLSDAELRDYLARLARYPGRVTIVSHNALFDMCIMAWVYGYLPTLMADTLGMARAMLGHALRSLSLDSVATYLKLGVKGKTVHKVQGMTLDDIIAHGLYDEYAQYSCDDADLCFGIYRELISRGFPPSELVIMDTVLRCAVMPRFVLNPHLLAEHLQATLQGKADLLIRAGLNSRDDLMSNDRFAEALRRLGVEPPTKISPKTGKETWAFAKTDQDFLDLEEHEDPQVQALVAARLGAKSTIEETRTERFLSISRLQWGDGQVGLLPVPLRFSGAHTHRLSGDWKLNMQNLPSRGNNKLRSAIEAPPGHKVLARDSSQIEARTAAWFCGVDEMVQQFANKEDVYSTFATSAFGYEVHKKTHPVERFVGKTCLGPDTLVLTDTGWVPITYVTTSHRLWDGIEWVTHRGLLYQGMKQVLTHKGLSATLDHEILTEHGWEAWSAVHKNRSLFQSALALASCGLSIGYGIPPQVSPPGGNPFASALADGAERSTATTLKAVGRRVAKSAQGSLTAGSGTGSTWALSRMTRTVLDYLIGFLQLSPGATTAQTQPIDTMACAASVCSRDGKTIVPTSFGTPKPFPGGIIRLSKWIGSTLTGITSPAISGLFPEAATCQTNAGLKISKLVSENSKLVSENSKLVSPVYDIANAGPRHRFTVLTDDGPIVVSNCVLGLQYGLGWPKFQRTTAMQSKAQLGQEIALTDEQAAKIVATYRTRYHAIPRMWRFLESLLPQMTRRDFQQQVGPVVFEYQAIRLPNGLRLRYHNLRCDDTGQWSFDYGGKTKYIYGGKMLENITQALARICIMDAALRVRLWADREGIPVWLNLQVHDELVYVVPDELVELVDAKVAEEMNRRPRWAPGLPLDSEGGLGQSFGDT